MKKVLILCTGNSCRSIMAEAVVNHFFENNVKAYSSGVKANGMVSPDTLKAVKEYGLKGMEYLKSKMLHEVPEKEFDLVITVSDEAKLSCPIFPQETKTVHIGVEDPTGKKFFKYLRTIHDLKENILPIIKKELLSN